MKEPDNTNLILKISAVLLIILSLVSCISSFKILVVPTLFLHPVWKGYYIFSGLTVSFLSALVALNCYYAVVDSSSEGEGND